MRSKAQTIGGRYYGNIANFVLIAGILIALLYRFLF
jgi:hypothetical protein